MPTLVVALGLLAIWVTRRSPASAALPLLGLLDLIWCAVALFAKQVSLVGSMGIESTPSAVWGMLLTALVPALLLKAIPSRLQRVWASWAVVSLASVLLVADNVYGRWFGDMFPAVALLAVGHIGSVAGGAWNLVVSRDGWFFFDVVLALPLIVAVCRLSEHRRPSPTLRYGTALVGVVVMLIAGWQTISTLRLKPGIVTQRFSNLDLVAHTGPLAFHALDAWLLIKRSAARELMPEATFVETRAWFDQRRALRAGDGPSFGAATGMNLVVIQVESLQAPMVNFHINGEAVMPNLARLEAEGLSFSQVFDQTDEGRTSDAEWLGLTSLLPEQHGAAAFVDAADHLVGMPQVLASAGYRTLSAVAFSPAFWNRRVMHPRYGFQSSAFAADFAPGERIGWGLNDRDFLLQMVPKLSGASAPFAAWLITLSLHYPFEAFPDRHKKLDLGEWRDTPFGNYIHGMHYFDQALGEFLAALKGTGELARTLVVVTGDHSAGFPWTPELAHAFGFGNNLLNWTLADRVPLVIHVPGGSAQRIDVPVGQVDLAPTVLNLLGIDAASLPYVGRNMLGSPGDEPVVRRDGSWVDARHLFLLRSGATGTHCYDRVRLVDVPLAECEAGSATAALQVEMARRVREFDLQQRLLAESFTPAPK